MTFAAWSPLVVGLGAIAIALALFALQRLRVQRRVVPLAGASLWMQAAREAPPRVLGGLFSRLPAYLLALAIALCLWLAASRPAPDAAGDGRFHLFYLDASALMLPGSRFADARNAMLADLARLPTADREVVLGDGHVGRLLAPGEDNALLLGRLGSNAAVATPSRFAAWLAGAGTGRSGPVTVHYYGARAAYAGVVAGRGDVRLSAGYLAEPLPRNHGIVALGVSPAVSGAWDRADILVALSDGIATPGLDAVRVTVDDRDLPTGNAEALGGGRFLLHDVPATGGRMDVAWRDSDGFPADDHAAIVLPDRRPVRVAIGTDVPATLARAIRLDPAFRTVAPGAAQVIVGNAPAAGSLPPVPTLLLTSPDAQAATFVFTDPDRLEDGALPARLDQLGLGQLDAGAMADELGRAVGVGVDRGPTRRVAVWRDVFNADSGFARSAALPLFVSQSLRWLARPDPWIPYAGAGDLLVDQSALYGLSDDPALTRRRLNDAIYLPQAGDMRIAERPLAVALTDETTTRLAAAPSRAPTPAASLAPPPARYPDLPLAALLIVAAVLLAVEWRLFQRGRMA